MNTTLVRGSYGSLTVHNSSGLILARERDEGSAEYDDILWFDPARLPRYDYGECDILDCAFVSDKGVYTRELVCVDDFGWVDQLYLEYHS